MDFKLVVLKQKPAYELRISDWSSDVCSSDLRDGHPARQRSLREARPRRHERRERPALAIPPAIAVGPVRNRFEEQPACVVRGLIDNFERPGGGRFERRKLGASILRPHRSEEHTSELQSLMRISYAVFCLKKTTKHTHQ